MNQFDFPAYLAFGKLNRETIRSEGEFEVADYYLLEEKVFEVKVAQTRAQVEEVFRGKRSVFTTHQTLERAVTHQFLCWKPSTSPVLHFLIRQTCDLGNIYFEAPSDDKKQVRCIFYPAAYLFVFRIPVTQENLFAVLGSTLDPVLIRYRSDFYITELINMDWKDKIEREQINLLELIVPMAYVHEVAKHLIEKKMVLTEKKYRMIIQDVSLAGSDILQGFSSTGDDPWKTYAIKLQGLTTNKM